MWAARAYTSSRLAVSVNVSESPSGSEKADWRIRRLTKKPGSALPNRCAVPRNTGGRFCCQSTLWAGSWPRPSWARSASSLVQIERIAPPASVRVSASTAMPPVETSGSPTVWANTNSAVPLPLS